VLLDEEDDEVEGTEDDELLDDEVELLDGAVVVLTVLEVQFTPMLPAGAVIEKFLRLTLRTPSTR